MIGCDEKTPSYGCEKNAVSFSKLAHRSSFFSPVYTNLKIADFKSLNILDFNPLAPEFRKNSFNPAGKLQFFRSVKLIEIH